MKYKIKKVLSKAIIFVVTTCCLGCLVSCATEKMLSSDIDQNPKTYHSELLEYKKFREEWLAEEAQRTGGYFFVYHRNYTPSQKQAVWIGKLAEVLDINWTQPERQHILYMIEFIKNDKIGIDLLEKYPLESNDEINQWVEYAMAEFNWPKGMVYEILNKQCLYIAMTDADKERVLIMDTYKYNPDNGPSVVRKFRNEWLLSDDYRRIGLATGSPSQQQAIWIGKIEEVLELDCWSEPERQHLISMIDLVKNSVEIRLRGNCPEDVREKIEKELIDWCEYAKKELGWNQRLENAIISDVRVKSEVELKNLNLW